MTRRSLVITTALALLGGAGLLAVPGGTALPAAAEAGPVAPAPRVEPPTPTVAGTIAEGLRQPWGLAFLPGGEALVSERDTAAIKSIAADGTVTEVGEVPGVVPGGEGGLLGIAVAPTFEQDHFVYAQFTAAEDNRIVRMTYTGGKLGAPEVILDGLPKAQIHNGGRLAFGPDGLLYATAGDASDGDSAQDPDALGGKILRLTPDGKPAPDNPSGTAVYTLGHRNPQGLAFDPDGRLWSSELGQDTWDELNLIEGGQNYGWPIVEGIGDDPAYVNPLAQWSTADASPSGLAYLQDTLWMAALRGERLWAIPVKDGKLDGEPKAFFVGEHGRLRTIAPAPDGSLWLVTDGSDGQRILRLTLG